MARQRKRDQLPQALDRHLMEQLMFGAGRVRRFTQDSPILPDVWLEYAQVALPRGSAGRVDPFPPLKLLITPFREASAGEVRHRLCERLSDERRSTEWKAFGHPTEPLPRTVYNQSTVSATLYFEDLIRAVLPMTDWWVRLGRQWNIQGMQTESVQDVLAKAVVDPEHPPSLETGNHTQSALRLHPALLWMIRVVGALAVVLQGQPLPEGFLGKAGVTGATIEDWKVLVVAVARLIRNVQPADAKALIYSVSLNREATPTIARSTLAVKADAARLLFNISCRDLAWAIVDSGIDARHPAFRQRMKGELHPPAEDDSGEALKLSRVVATYDFNQIDLLLDPDTDEQPAHLEQRLAKNGEEAEQLRRELDDLNSALRSGRALDWKLIAKCLQIPHDPQKYTPPGMANAPTGAGLLASDWKSAESGGMIDEDLVGVCPDLRLYDLRVLSADGRGDEFTVMAAVQ